MSGWGQLSLFIMWSLPLVTAYYGGVQSVYQFVILYWGLVHERVPFNQIHHCENCISWVDHCEDKLSQPIERYKDSLRWFISLINPTECSFYVMKYSQTLSFVVFMRTEKTWQLSDSYAYCSFNSWVPSLCWVVCQNILLWAQQGLCCWIHNFIDGPFHCYSQQTKPTSRRSP